MFNNSQAILLPLKKSNNWILRMPEKCSPCNNLLFTLENRQSFILVQAFFNSFQNIKLTRNILLWVLRLGKTVYQNGLKAIVNFLWKSTSFGNLSQLTLMEQVSSKHSETSPCISKCLVLPCLSYLIVLLIIFATQFYLGT